MNSKTCFFVAVLHKVLSISVEDLFFVYFLAPAQLELAYSIAAKSGIPVEYQASESWLYNKEGS